VIRLSLAGCRFWGEVEGCVLHPYHGKDDPPGVMTIYRGHVIRPGDDIVSPYTIEKADYWTRRDTAWMQAWLWRHCPWSTGEPNGRQHNFDALCSLVGNAGHVFDDLLAEVNGANRPDAVRKIWMSHTKASGSTDPNALAFRRAREVAFYLTPDPPLFDEDTVRETIARVVLDGRRILGEDGFGAG